MLVSIINYILLFNIVYLPANNIDTGKISLKIISAPATIKSNADVKVKLEVRNISNENILVPGEYWIDPSSGTVHFGNIAFEVLYCVGDSNYTVTGPTPFFPYPAQKLVEERSLKPGETQPVSALIDGGYFKKQGKYKLRFKSVYTKYLDNLPQLTTGWLEIEVNDYLTRQ